MKHKFALSFGGTALAAGLLLLVAPWAAHAVAAALVQVTNTAQNPAVAQDIGQSASQMVYLTNLFSTPVNGVATFGRYIPGGSSVPNFTVPANQWLVITAIDISPACTGPVGIDLSDSPGGQFTFKPLYVNNASDTMTHLVYPSGLFVAGGLQPSVVNRANGNCFVEVDLHGYLTSN